MSKETKEGISNTEVKQSISEQQKQAINVLFEIAELAQSSGVIKTTKVASLVYSSKQELSKLL